MQRLRPLSEAECYTRLYGGRETTVTVIGHETPEARLQGGILGDQLRQVFEEHESTRELGVGGAEAA